MMRKLRHRMCKTKTEWPFDLKQNRTKEKSLRTRVRFLLNSTQIYLSIRDNGQIVIFWPIFLYIKGWGPKIKKTKRVMPFTAKVKEPNFKEIRRTFTACSRPLAVGGTS